MAVIERDVVGGIPSNMMLYPAELLAVINWVCLEFMLRCMVLILKRIRRLSLVRSGKVEERFSYDG